MGIRAFKLMLLLVIMILVVACSKTVPSDAPVDTPIGDLVDEIVDDPADIPIEDPVGVPNQDLVEDPIDVYVCPPGEQGDIAIEFLRKDRLCAGIIEGLEFQIGDYKAEIREKLGPPIESNYYSGGKYDLYDLGQYSVLYFGSDNWKVDHIWLYTKEKVALQTVRDILGDADNEQLYGEDEDDIYADWVLSYDFGNYSLYVHGEKEGDSPNVKYLFLKQMNISEAYHSEALLSDMTPPDMSINKLSGTEEQLFYWLVSINDYAHDITYLQNASFSEEERRVKKRYLEYVFTEEWAELIMSGYYTFDTETKLYSLKDTHWDGVNEHWTSYQVEVDKQSDNNVKIHLKAIDNYYGEEQQIEYNFLIEGDTLKLDYQRYH